MIGDKGRRAEKLILAELGAEPTIASGATDRQRGDGEDTLFLYEVKSSVRNRIPVLYADLCQLVRDATGAGKVPAFVIAFTDPSGTPIRGGKWVCLELDTYRELRDDGIYEI